MNRSDQIAELATALAKAQGAIENATKGTINPHFKRKYADLASIRDVIRKPLSDNGLAYVQAIQTNGKRVEVETTIMHASGQWISEVMVVPALQETAQALGSAITYARRYSLSALLGVAAEGEDEDDGIGATEPSSWPHEELPPPIRDERPPPTVTSGRPSQKARDLALELAQCETLEDIAIMRDTEEFKTAWAILSRADREHIVKTVDRRKAELDPGDA